MKKNGLLLFFLCMAAMGFSQRLPALKINEVVEFYEGKQDSVYIINFWATFCKPCVAEIPYLQSTVKKYAASKVSLLLVSLDLPAFYPSTIEKFATSHQFTAPIAWLNESDADYFCPKIDSSWSGAIPATLFVNGRKGYKHFVGEEMSEARFEAELVKVISGNK